MLHTTTPGSSRNWGHVHVLKATFDGNSGLNWLNAAAVGGDYVVLYLEHGDSERVSQVMMGRQQHFAVVSVQIHTGQQVQLWVDPVQPLVRQVWRRGRKGERSPQGNSNGPVAKPSIFCDMRKHTKTRGSEKWNWLEEL